MRVLLVEDDPELAEGILDSQSVLGHTIDWVQDGEEALLALSLEDFDALILDLMMPKIDGLTVLERLRKKNNPIPVLILSALSEIQDRVVGLNAGADDYMTKPFDLLELGARLNAIGRRRSGRSISLICHAGIQLEPSEQRVTYKGENVALIRKEFYLLRELLEKKGRILSKEYLGQAVYGWQQEIESNAIEVHISNLRKKLYKNLIRTVRGIGYVVESDVA